MSKPMRAGKRTTVTFIAILAVVMAALFISPAAALTARSDYPGVVVRSPFFASRTSTGSSFQVNWSGVQALLNQTPVRYHVAYKEQGEAAYKPLPTLGSRITKSTGAVFSGESGRTYLFKVSAEDSAGRKGPAAESKTIVPVDDGLSPSGAFTGEWNVAAGERFYFRSEHQSRKGGSAFTYNFDGRQVHLIGSVGPDRGRARIYLDGVYRGTVDLYSVSVKMRRVIWSSPELKPVGSFAPHRLKVVAAGTPGRPLVGIDAVARVK